LKTYYSHGKLLLTGEYAVLDGALALAVPTKMGQYMRVTSTPLKGIRWKSVGVDGNIWYEDFFDEIPINFVPSEKQTVRETLLSILSKAKNLNPNFLSTSTGWEIITQLEFPKPWGLGSSSTLINNIAQWAEVDAFQLLKLSFGGSGYDIAAAQNDSPILYQLINNRPISKRTTIDWGFKDQLFFVYLNRKQNSKDGILKYRQANSNQEFIDNISDLTNKIHNARTLSEFELWVEQHENIIGQINGLPKVKETYFPEYTGSIKSLGAWGGDFIMASGSVEDQDYFKKKGFQTIISFRDMVI
jgi:mevalonate kinase